MPGDGFCAWGLQNNLTADFLRGRIEEAVVRIMRDKRRKTISLDEIKREVSPIIARERKGWDAGISAMFH